MKINVKNSYDKNDQIFQFLQKQIRTGALPAGGRLPSERMLAEVHQCSRVTVRGVLERLGALHLIERVPGSGSYVSKNQWNIRGRRIALVLRSDSPDFFEDPYFSQLMPGFYASTGAADYAAPVIVVRPDENLQTAWARQQCRLEDYSGFIVQYALQESEVDWLTQHGCKVVALMPADGNRNVSHVDIDNAQGSYLATRHLLELNYRRPIFLNGPETIAFNRDKRSGFEKALREFRIPFQPERMIGTVNPGCEKDAARIAEELLARSDYRFDSLIVYGDWAAWGVISTLQRHEIRIPDDVALIMYDDFPWVSRVSDVALTVVRQPFAEQIESAVRLLVRQLQNSEEATTVQIIQPSLIIRKSSGITLNRNLD